MKYTIITQRYGCHLLVEALLRSVEKYLSPDEILVLNNTYSEKSLGEDMHRQILKVKNDYFLMLDQDIMIFDNNFVEEMYRLVSEPDAFACGAIDLDYNQRGVNKILVASCNMINKKRYIENGIYFYTSEPCVESFVFAVQKGQKLVKVGKNIDTVSIAPEVFHMNQGFHTLYPDLILSGWWKRIFEIWKEESGSKEKFEDYVIDDGMDYDDQLMISTLINQTIQCCPEMNRSFSLLRLEEEGVELLTDYYEGKQVDKKLAEELIEYIKEANWIDHSHLFKGCYNNLYDYQSSLKYSELYEKIGVKFRWISDYSGRYCLPIQNYLFFIKDLNNDNFYSLVKGKRIRYAGSYDAIGELNRKKDLGLTKYEYCTIENFFDNFNVKDWDIIFVSGDIYANIIVGKVKQMGGVVINIGDAILFNPNENIKKVLALTEDGINYTIKDGYTNYGKRLYEKYLMEK